MQTARVQLADHIEHEEREMPLIQPVAHAHRHQEQLISRRAHIHPRRARRPHTTIARIEFRRPIRHHPKPPPDAGPGCCTQPLKPCSGGTFTSRTGQNPVPPDRSTFPETAHTTGEIATASQTTFLDQASARGIVLCDLTTTRDGTPGFARQRPGRSGCALGRHRMRAWSAKGVRRRSSEWGCLRSVGLVEAFADAFVYDARRTGPVPRIAWKRRRARVPSGRPRLLWRLSWGSRWARSGSRTGRVGSAWNRRLGSTRFS